ncbi:MAG TPA: two-component regulator propeller domain-containing protein, partial [Opitutaceae bacterium]|nr:two-component regulator propeller domain-containing protein [Opitutaceae bacterium]
MSVRAAWILLLWAVSLPAQQYLFVPVAQSPRNIESMLEDRQGRLWITTHDDVLCFDGTRFFSLRKFGLPPAFPSWAAEDSAGGILIALPVGLYRFFQGSLQLITPAVYINEAVEVAPGVLLASGGREQQPLFYRARQVHGEWRTDEITGWKTGWNLTHDRSGAVLYACAGGWCELPAGRIVNWSPGRPGGPIFHKSVWDMQRVLRDRDGCLWFRSTEAGAYQCPGDAHPVSLPPLIAGRNVWADEWENSDGTILFANVGSLAVGRPGAFHVALPADGLPPDAVTSAVQSRDGSIWVGSIGGLYRFVYPFRMRHWNSGLGLIWSLARSRRGIIAGTSAGVARLDATGEWKVLPGSRQFGSIGSLLPQPDGSLYAAVSREGVILLRPDGSLAARTPPGQGGTAQALAQAGDGSIWAAGSGIFRVVRNAQVLFLVPENPGRGPASDVMIAAAPGGGIWACFAGNLMRQEGRNWRTIAQDGVPPGVCRGLAFAGADVWAGYNLGFVMVQPETDGPAAVRVFPATSDTGDTATYAFAADRRGWLWRGSSDGIHVADQSQAQRGVWLHLNYGLSDVDVNHGSLFIDTDGSVWWAAAISLVHFIPPPDLIHPHAPPAVFLSAFSWEGSPPALADALREFPARKRLTAHLGSLDFEDRNALRVRYRLLPEQKDWRETSALDLDLGAPWWGTHTLEMQSRLSMGSWSQTWSRTLMVVRPWWFSWPALLVFLGIGCGGTAGGLNWRRKLRARAQTILPDLADWRLAALSPESQLAGVTLDGRFKVLRVVARGGFATVLKGRDLRHAGRPCAIKIFRREVLDGQWLAHRFQQEVAALEQIHHPSVVSIYAHG